MRQEEKWNKFLAKFPPFYFFLLLQVGTDALKLGDLFDLHKHAGAEFTRRFRIKQKLWIYFAEVMVILKIEIKNG